MNKLVVLYSSEDVRRFLSMQGNVKLSDTLILAIDPLSWVALRRVGAGFTTPREYTPKDDCRRITSQAVRLAKTWHNALNNELTEYGINFGEMLECDFSYIFIDATRCFRIAENILDRERPSIILVPKEVPKQNPGAIRYGELVSSLKWIARSRHLTVTELAEPLGSLGREEQGAMTRLQRRRLDLYNLFFQIEERYDYDKLRLTSSQGERRRALFVGFIDATFLPLKSDLEKRLGIEARNIPLTTIKRFGRAERLKRILPSTEDVIASVTLLELREQEVECLREILKSRFAEFASESLPELIHLASGMIQVLRKTKPSLVIMPEDMTPERRTLAKVCQSQGVKTLLMLPAAPEADMGGFIVMPKVANMLAVWGKATKTWYVERGINPNSLVTIGNPRYDLIPKLKLERTNRVPSILRQLRLKPGQPTIVIATAWYSVTTACHHPEDHFDFLEQTLRATKELQNVNVLIKLHPGYSDYWGTLAKSILEHENMSNVAVTPSRLWDVLAVCDVLITQTSTVGLEAMLFDKAVITFNSEGTAEQNPYARSDAVVEVEEPSKLAGAIRECLFSKETQTRLAEGRRVFVTEYANIQEERATKRMADLMREMIDQ